MQDKMALVTAPFRHPSAALCIGLVWMADG
jgi:hypothetical protein